MTKEKKAGKKNAVAAKNILTTITEQLTASLTSLKEQLGEKKFTKRVKKAAKVLVAGIEKKPVKKVAAKPKKAVPVKKVTKKAALKKV